MSKDFNNLTFCKKNILLFLCLFLISLYVNNDSLAAQGELNIYTIKNGAAIDLKSLTLNGIEFKLNSNNGHSKLFLEEGEYNLSIPNEDLDEHNIKINIHENLSSDILINLFDNKMTSTLSDTKYESYKYSESNNLNLAKLKLKITDELTNNSIENAKVYVSGVSTVETTNQSGELNVFVPADDSFTISVVHKNFEMFSEKWSLASLNLDQLKLIKLRKAPLKLKEIVVVSPKIGNETGALIEFRKNSQSVVDLVGSDQAKKSGDSDAGSSLKRVTGLSLVDGKYIYVRGLGDRYSRVMLNGLNLATPDPSKRSIPLDMVPSSLLDKMAVQKSYSADQPGEFGGGSIQLYSKKSDYKTKAKIGLSYKIKNDGEQARFAKGGSKDWMGHDDGTRKLPNGVAKAAEGNRELRENNRFYSKGFSAEELGEIGKEFSANYSTDQKKEIIPGKLDLSLDSGWKLNAWKFGLSGSGLYSSDIDYKEKSSRSLVVSDNNNLTEGKSFDYQNSSYEVSLAGAFEGSVYYNEDHHVNILNFVSRSTDEIAHVKYGNDGENIVRNTTIAWKERELRVKQFVGEHKIKELRNSELNWKFGFSEANSISPDRKEYSYIDDKGSWRLAPRDNGVTRIFSELNDTSEESFLSFNFPTVNFSNVKTTFKIGRTEEIKNRDSHIRRFSFKKSDLPGALKIDSHQNLDEILSPNNIGPYGYQLKESTRATDNYSGTQNVMAYFGSIKNEILSNITFVTGWRIEESNQRVTTYALFDPYDTPIVANLKTRDVLPSYSLTWKLNSSNQIRSAYGETIARPDFRELSESEFSDDEGDIIIVGNKDLKNTVINNFDLRWEWYNKYEDAFSLGGFYKKFIDPIESVYLAGTEEKKTYQNASEAVNYGLELDYRKSMGFLTRFLKNFSVMGNFSYVYSRVLLNETNQGIQTSNERSLQGQSPTIVNFQIMYSKESLNLDSSLSYNVSGRRISDVGVRGAPDVYEESFHQLDFVMRKKFKDYGDISFKVGNLLNPKVKLTQGGNIIEEYSRDRSMTVGYSYVF